MNDLLTRRASYKDKDRDTPIRQTIHTDRESGKFGEKINGILGERGQWFCSDHAFDGFISPVTNPFLFEDPRSITELRPIYIYQKMPGGQPDFHGGNVQFFGTQARLAITNRLSFTVNKLGGIWLNPGGDAPVGGGSAFSELWFGPKYTFIRDDCGTLLAGGLQFQAATGGAKAYQNTGALSLVPYVSWGQNFLKDSLYQGLNTVVTGGYSFGTSSARTSYLYLSGHVDVPVRITDTIKIYPLAEMNWFLNTTNGSANPLGIEGRDLINFGGQAKGQGLLTGAFGARAKFTEAFQFGGAFEFPFAGPKDLFQYRFTVDFIWRY